jgi:hypothetical protein
MGKRFASNSISVPIYERDERAPAWHVDDYFVVGRNH